MDPRKEGVPKPPRTPFLGGPGFGGQEFPPGNSPPPPLIDHFLIRKVGLSPAKARGVFFCPRGRGKIGPSPHCSHFGGSGERRRGSRGVCTLFPPPRAGGCAREFAFPRGEKVHTTAGPTVRAGLRGIWGSPSGKGPLPGPSRSPGMGNNY